MLQPLQHVSEANNDCASSAAYVVPVSRVYPAEASCVAVPVTLPVASGTTDNRPSTRPVGSCVMTARRIRVDIHAQQRRSRMSAGLTQPIQLIDTQPTCVSSSYCASHIEEKQLLESSLANVVPCVPLTVRPPESSEITQKNTLAYSGERGTGGVDSQTKRHKESRRKTDNFRRKRQAARAAARASKSKGVVTAALDIEVAAPADSPNGIKTAQVWLSRVK